MLGMNSRHLAKGDKCPQPKPDRMTMYNMRYCPYAQRAILTALAKNLDVDVVNINLTEKPEWYEDKNPLKMVPALEKGEDIIIESLVVADYLDEKYPTPKLAADTLEQRAKDSGLVAEYGNKVVSNQYKLYKPKEPQEADEIVDNLKKGLAYMEAELKKRGTPYYGGQKVRLVDYMIWPHWERLFALEALKRLQLEWSQYPLLTAWIKRMEDDPIVKKYRVSTDIHVQFINGFAIDKPRYDFLDDN